MQESKETDIETPPPPKKKGRNKETVQFRESLIWVYWMIKYQFGI